MDRSAARGRAGWRSATGAAARAAATPAAPTAPARQATRSPPGCARRGRGGRPPTAATPAAAPEAAPAARCSCAKVSSRPHRLHIRLQECSRTVPVPCVILLSEKAFEGIISIQFVSFNNNVVFFLTRS